MRAFTFHRFWGAGLLALLALPALLTLQPGPSSPPPIALEPAPALAAKRKPTATPTELPTATPTELPTATPTLPPGVTPTPTPRPPGTPWRVGLQVGHWKTEELPEELARLRTSTGARAAGYTELQVNLDVAQRVALLLQAQGVVVDVLPATVPPSYDADAFVTIHADGSSNPAAHGYKLATPWRTSRASQHLHDAITAEYGAATGMPWDNAITVNMKGYYAFSYSRHQHAIARTTPAVIVEMGFLTNAGDRSMMINNPDLPARAIADGIMRYLRERDPNDGAALLPPEFKPHRALSPDGVNVYAAPSEDARVLARVGPDARISPYEQRDGWYHVFTRSGEQRVMGWVRADQVAPSADPTPTAPPATDS